MKIRTSFIGSSLDHPAECSSDAEMRRYISLQFANCNDLWYRGGGAFPAMGFVKDVPEATRMAYRF
jgi:hypothetical protein